MAVAYAFDVTPGVIGALVDILTAITRAATDPGTH